MKVRLDKPYFVSSHCQLSTVHNFSGKVYSNKTNSDGGGIFDDGEDSDDDDSGTWDQNIKSDNDNESSENEDEEDANDVEVLKTRKGRASAMQRKMKGAIKKSGQGSGSSIVCTPLLFALKSSEIYVVNALKPGEMPWFLPIAYVVMLVKLQFEDDHPNVPLPPWLSTFFKITVRAKEHGENKYFRNDAGYTSSIFGWVNEIKSEESDNAIMKIKQRATWVFETIRDHFTDEGGGGKLLLEYIKENSRVAPDGKVMGLYNSLTKGRPPPHPNVEKHVIQKTMHAAFSCTPTFEVNVPMDKYMTDDDIKSIVEEHLGANKWKDVSTSNRKACFKTKWSKKSIPDWSTIHKESY